PAACIGPLTAPRRKGPDPRPLASCGVAPAPARSRPPALENVRDVPNVVAVGWVDRTGPGPFTCFMTETPTAPSATGPSSIAVLTSGGDAGGMNPAIRAVVRTALHHGIDVYAVADGYRGLIQGAEAIRRAESADVGGILQRGGTILGTARSLEFQEREGRRRCAAHRAE